MSYNPVPGADGRIVSFVRWHRGRLECRKKNIAVVIAGVIGGTGALLLALGLLYLLTGGRVHPIGQAAGRGGEPAQSLALGLFGVIFGLVLAACAAAGASDLMLDPARRRYRLRRGLWRWARRSEGGFDEVAGLRLRRYRRWWKPTRTYYRLSLEWKDGRQVILALWVRNPLLLVGREAHADARAYMGRLAERLGLATIDET